jgi:hypothetical protein
MEADTRRRIHLPMTKNGRSFDLPILQLHHEISAPLRPLSRHWVFPSPKSAIGHITRPERLKFNPHMHRRTFATVAMEAGVLEEIVGRLLIHTPLSIAGRCYIRPRIEALRPAMLAACNELSKRAGLARLISLTVFSPALVRLYHVPLLSGYDESKTLSHPIRLFGPQALTSDSLGQLRASPMAAPMWGRGFGK